MIKTRAYINLCVCLSCFKLLFLKSYVSTDFDVHRNWMAITFNLPIKDWYYDKTHEGTLDYPPLFAIFEFVLAHTAHFLSLNNDEQLLRLTGAQVRTDTAVIYQKLTVIISDLVYYYAIYKLCGTIQGLFKKTSQKYASADNEPKDKRGGDSDPSHVKDGKWKTDKSARKQQDVVKSFELKTQNLSDAIYRPDTLTCIQLLLLLQPGLLLVDHIHFQYNGFLNGVLLLSIANILEARHLEGAFWFSILLNLKHIYLYCAPAFGMYLLASYCLVKHTGTNRFLSSIYKASRLGSIVVLIFVITYSPFADVVTLKQIGSRLFPFKRGLTHAYWAPNAWSLYNSADKVLATVFKDSLIVKFDLESISRTKKISSTSGLVEEYEHQYLPSIKPMTTFILVGVFTVPVVVKYLSAVNRDAPKLFLKGVVLTSFTSFMFGWHVHEKAIITVLLPLVPVSYLEPKLWPTFMRLTLAGTYSLFPLLFKPVDFPTKVCILVTYYCYARSQCPRNIEGTHNYGNPQHQVPPKQMNFCKYLWFRCYDLLDKGYVLILILNETYMTFVFGRLNYDWNPIAVLNKFQFLPLMATSSLSAIAIASSYMEIYYDFALSKAEDFVSS